MYYSIKIVFILCVFFSSFAFSKRSSQDQGSSKGKNIADIFKENSREESSLKEAQRKEEEAQRIRKDLQIMEEAERKAEEKTPQGMKAKAQRLEEEAQKIKNKVNEKRRMRGYKKAGRTKEKSRLKTFNERREKLKKQLKSSDPSVVADALKNMEKWKISYLRDKEIKEAVLGLLEHNDVIIVKYVLKEIKRRKFQDREVETAVRKFLIRKHPNSSVIKSALEIIGEWHQSRDMKMEILDFVDHHDISVVTAALKAVKGSHRDRDKKVERGISRLLNHHDPRIVKTGEELAKTKSFKVQEERRRLEERRSRIRANEEKEYKEMKEYEEYERSSSERRRKKRKK